MNSKVIDLFLKYVSVDTQSMEDVEHVPSTEKQHNLAKILVEELEGLGLEKVNYDTEHCYIYATIPSNLDKETKRLGFIAHMDTSPEISGKDVKARIIENYDGKDILLNSDKNIVMKTSDYKELEQLKGKSLIVTDGTTLLGADDKAGVSEIMAMAHFLCENPQIPHGEIQIGFTPDEEVGNGPEYFDVEKFHADYAYTVDGGALGELEYENFNGASAKIKINGISIHPGDAKDRMVNAVLVGMELNNMLPENQIPARTEKYEGFYHLMRFNGAIEEATMEYIIRDHDMEKFTQKKELLEKIVLVLNQKYGEGTIELDLKDSYYNMKEKIEPHMHLIDNAKKAFEDCDVVPKVVPIRGGTDGARLSFMGLPCPNLSTGGANYHGRFEYACVESMESMVQVLLKLVETYSK